MDFNNLMKEGEISEWNEGNFKSMRLHFAQQLINESKINLLGVTNGVANYMLWFKGVDIMFGEGMQKYSGSEYTECKRMKDAIEESLEKKQFFTPIRQSNRKGIRLDVEKWKEIKKLIEDFEYKVKTYNDKHGLSTKNLGTKGLF